MATVSCYLDGVTASAPWPDLFLSTQLSADKSYSRKPLAAHPAAGRGFPRASQCGGMRGWFSPGQPSTAMKSCCGLKKKENYIYAIRSLIVGQLNLAFLAIKVFVWNIQSLTYETKQLCFVNVLKIQKKNGMHFLDPRDTHHAFLMRCTEPTVNMSCWFTT